MRSTSVLFFLLFVAVLIAANPIAGPTEHDERRGTQLKRRDLGDADFITPLHAPFNKRTPVKTSKTTKKKTTPKSPKAGPKGPKTRPKKNPKNAKDSIACPLRKSGAKPGGGKKTGKSRRDLERRCSSTPSTKWTTYNTKGAAYLATYETKRAAGANKATEAAIQKVLDEEYFPVATKNVGADVNLRDYMSRVLQIPAASLTSGYTQYETFSCKPPENAESLSTVRLRIYMQNKCNIPSAYRNQFDATNGVILADSNFANNDTNRARADLTPKPALSDLLFLQYKKLATAAGVSVTKLKYIARVKIVNVDTAAMITEAHAHADAPADNVIAGWKKWSMLKLEHKEMIETFAGTDNGKASPFILQDWAGHLKRKSIVAVHTDIEPTSGAKYMIWEFSD